jgi:hypothetical protein
LNRFIIKGVKFWGQEKEVEIKVFYVKKWKNKKKKKMK